MFHESTRFNSWRYITNTPADEARLMFCSGFGDHITLLFVYDSWVEAGSVTHMLCCVACCARVCVCAYVCAMCAFVCVYVRLYS